MSFGQNLQFLRKISNKMTQEELAEKLSVSRQTVSKWELDLVYPEINKLVELCNLFSCSMDELIRQDMNIINDAYSDIRIETVEEFYYIKYAVISTNPEATRLTPDINNIRVIISGFSFKNTSPSLARLSTLSLLSLLFSGILIKNSKAIKATIKLPISTAITPVRPTNEYNAVAIKGFNIDINDLDRERSPLVL